MALLHGLLFYVRVFPGDINVLFLIAVQILFLVGLPADRVSSVVIAPVKGIPIVIGGGSAQVFAASRSTPVRQMAPVWAGKFGVG